MEINISGTAWDAKAASYDKLDRKGFAAEWMREVSVKELLKHFSPGMRLLEIGCGTGEDALALCEHGYRIDAIDSSKSMIRAAQEKSSRSGKGTAAFKVLSAEKLEILDSGAYNGAYSFLGPVNCIPDMQRFSVDLGRVIQPGGYFISSVMNRVCLFEIIFFLARADGRGALRRFGRNPVNVQVRAGYTPVPVWYYSPEKYYECFKNTFILNSVRALPLLPPHLLEKFCEYSRGVRGAILQAETALGPCFPLRCLGE